jgi:nucleotide-binding universal stress UspA family protein
MTTTAPQLETRTYFKSILLATDFSNISASALSYAAAIAQAHQGVLLLGHVLPQTPRRPIPLEMPAGLETDRREAEYELEALASQDLLRHIRHEQRIERGTVWEVVLELIERENIDLLVLGTHARTGVKKLVLGSVTEELFRLAPCPVMTVGPEAPSHGGDGASLRRVLFATDFGPASRNALPYAVALANESRAQLILLHAIPPLPALSMGAGWYPGTEAPQREEKELQQAREKLEKLIPAGTHFVRDPEFVVNFELMPEGILKTAAEKQADLIVMGVRKATPTLARAAAHVPWATAHEVVCRAHCPVITVRG